MHGLAHQDPYYEPFGWHQWSDDMRISYRFCRGLGETHEGGGTIGAAQAKVDFHAG